MSGTLEITNNNIVVKINSINEIITILESKHIDIDVKIIDDIRELTDDYTMGSVNILPEYFLISNKIRQSDDKNEKLILHTLKNTYFQEYQIFVRKESFISKLDRIINLLKKCIKNNNFTKCVMNNIYSHIKQFENSSIDKNIKEVVYKMCNCSTKMYIDSASSMLVCKECGATKELFGTVFEDEQFYFQEGQRSKHGTYDPSKHCRFWVERIQARENTDIDPVVIKNIKECIKLDKIKNKNYISCILIRKYLRQTNNTKYNEHVPLIRKLITGITPPQLTDYEMQLIHIYFDKVIHIFDEIKPPKKTNCPYHPYFIYKIIEQILKKQTDYKRKIQILSCIHLQSRETLVSNDLIWKPICGRIDDFEYIPTDRNARNIDF